MPNFVQCNRGERAIGIGAIAEENVINELFRRGYDVERNQPCVDWDMKPVPGYDIIVNGKHKIEIKSCWGKSDDGRLYETAYLQTKKGNGSGFYCREDWYSAKYAPKFVILYNHATEEAHLYNRDKLAAWCDEQRHIPMKDSDWTLGVLINWIEREAGYITTFDASGRLHKEIGEA